MDRISTQITQDHLDQARTALRSISRAKANPDTNSNDARCLIGFDGFVDSIVDAVATRHEPGDLGYDRMNSLRDFAHTAEHAAGHSANIELVVKQTRPGGNGPILASALTALGTPVDCIAAIDHPVFDPLCEACAQHTTLGNPGLTDAIEFNDGKLMLGKTRAMDAITWERICNQAGGIDALIERCNAATIIAPCGWTMIPDMNDIWEHLAIDVLQELDQPRTRNVLIDFSDPAKRSADDLRTAIKIIQQINTIVPVTMGLNYAEARRLSTLHQIAHATTSDQFAPEFVAAISQSLRDRLGLFQIVIHHHKSAAIDNTDGCFSTTTAFTPTPRTSTGAGDHFNAGLCLALAHDLDTPTALITAVALSGSFVRTGQHPSLDEVIAMCSELQPDQG